jgi:hypothetical protein
MKQMLTDMGMGNVEVYGKGDADNLIPLIKISAMNGDLVFQSALQGCGLPQQCLVWILPWPVSTVRAENLLI